MFAYAWNITRKPTPGRSKKNIFKSWQGKGEKMTIQDILEYFNDINEAYNNPNKHDDLSKMLDMLTNREEDCYQVPKKALKYRTGEIIAYNYKWLKEHFDIEKSLICRKIEPCDAISREELIKKAVYTETTDGWSGYTVSAEDIKGMQSVQPKTGHCKDCKYFEYDSAVKMDSVPLIVAHEICAKWGNGCKTREDGYCFMFEPRESEGKTWQD